MDVADAHAYARERGFSRGLYRIVRAATAAIVRVWFRFRVMSADRIPADGPAIIALNHKNFLDPFFVGLAARRPVQYMAKVELTDGPFGGLLVRLGAFPVRRGQSDPEALETAREILRNGGVVVMFPEGTRVEQPDALGSPRHGAGRLAVETGAPIIPAAITGTSHLWRGALPKLKRVQIAFLSPIAPETAGEGPGGATALIDERVWPAVQEEYGRLRASPGLILAGLAAIGLGGGLVARRQLDAQRKPRILGKVEPRKLRRRKQRRSWLSRITPGTLRKDTKRKIRRRPRRG
jgi:1-acyl-sn-glycerol-3-phosphate acyltransferase